MDIDLEEIGFGALIALVIGGIFCFNLGLFDGFLGNDAGSSDDFELTTTSTTIGIGQEKEIVPGMAYTEVLDGLKWSSSDTNVLKISKDPHSTYGTAIITGVSEGTATVTASYGSCTRTCTVTVQTDAPDNELRVYNDNSRSNRYAVLSGPGFESGVLSFSFNVSGRAVVTMSGYTKIMLDANPKLIGGIYDFKKVVMEATDMTTGLPKASSSYDAEKSDSSLLLNLGTLSINTPYSIDFYVTPYYYTDPYHIKGVIEYKENDGSIDSTSVFKRPYAWRYGGNEYSFELEFSYGDYCRYHTKALSGAYRTSWGEIWNRSSADTSLFVKNNETLDQVNKELKNLYLEKFGSTASLKSMEYANFIMAFVQICWYYEYDEKQYTGGSSGEYFSYPMESVYSGCGDCDDTTVLTASLFKGAGYKAGTYGLPGHAMAAVHIDDYTKPSYDSDRYVYMAYYIGDPDMLYYGCETTYETFLSVGLTFKSALYDDYGNRYEDVKLYRL